MNLLWAAPVAVIVVAIPFIVGALRAMGEAAVELDHELGHWRRLQPSVVRVRDDAATVRAHVEELRRR